MSRGNLQRRDGELVRSLDSRLRRQWQVSGPVLVLAGLAGFEHPDRQVCASVRPERLSVRTRALGGRAAHHVPPPMHISLPKSEAARDWPHHLRRCAAWPPQSLLVLVLRRFSSFSSPSTSLFPDTRLESENVHKHSPEAPFRECAVRKGVLPASRPRGSGSTLARTSGPAAGSPSTPGRS